MCKERSKKTPHLSRNVPKFTKAFLLTHSSELNTLRKDNWELKNKIFLLENQLKSGTSKAAERIVREKLLIQAEITIFFRRLQIPLQDPVQGPRSL
jgi:hypothetical protein